VVFPDVGSSPLKTALDRWKTGATGAQLARTE
jgi:hypothetical protein